MTRRLVTLGEVCSQDRTSVRPGHADELAYLGLEGIESGTGRFLDGELSKTPEVPQANSFRFDERHVLYGKLRPYLNKVAVPTAPGKCSTEIIPLLPSAQIDRRYLSYFLRAPATVKKVAERSSGARMPRADMDFVLSLPISLPAMEEQCRIVDLLARAEGIVRLRREAQQKAAELIPAIFIDIFGDPATNPRGWPVHSLGVLAEVQGGLQVTRARSELPLERPYLRVANVHRGRLDLAEMKSIRLTEAEFRRTALQAGDLLVVEGHGNPQEVGRVATWDDSIPGCTHQNHLIRARPLRDRLLPEYACALLNSEAGRQTLLRAGKTTSGLSTISAQNVKDATVMLPPLADQLEFASRTEAVASLMDQQHEALVKARASFDALLSRAFH
ncbi:MAG: restriction endonuclease subunit S [Aquabacterium sp.]|nr:restriction endonuclease subunit S [Aquabacterium sp.]